MIAVLSGCLTDPLVLRKKKAIYSLPLFQVKQHEYIKSGDISIQKLIKGVISYQCGQTFMRIHGQEYIKLKYNLNIQNKYYRSADGL